ncbi:MAG: glycosyltransferase [Leptothrix ochracea]|uniref:glycosyltransferase family 2 protein n=3 Tax=Leptothrix ochracea TaxID=735331 RepID=UPI0034E2451E
MHILSIKDDRIKLIEPNDLNCAVLSDYVGFARQDDMLHPDALSWISCAIHCKPSAAIIYADEDQISDSNARMNPDFKPDWSPDFFRSAGYIGPFAVLRKHVILEAHLWDAIDRGLMGSQLIFHAVEEVLDAQCIVHVPQVLYHVRCLPQRQRLGAIQRATSALQAHLDRVFPGALAQHHGEDFSGRPWFRVRYPMPASVPLVSIIIPTRNAKSLVEQCIQSLVEKTTYKNYEIILVDNGSDDPESLQYFESLNGLPNITVVRDDGEFNYSKLNNDAVVKARGDYIVLMNNDIEIIHDDWLDEMISLGSRPGTGVVGAKLLYPDGRVQHAGVIAGLGGVAGHIHRYLESDQAGYQGRAVLTHNLLVVTAACLLVRRSIYESMGGLNDVDLKVAFNDVDFCLRVHQAGYMNVWTPFATLIHHESATRGLDDHPVKKARFLRECDFMHKTYDDLLKNDPFYNKNCTLNDESFHRSMPTRFSSVAFIDQLSA